MKIESRELIKELELKISTHREANDHVKTLEALNYNQGKINECQSLVEELKKLEEDQRIR